MSSDNYGQQKHSDLKSLYWAESPSENSSNNKSQTYFPTEKVEENIEEDSEQESELEFFGGTFYLLYNQFLFIKQTLEFKKLTAKRNNICSTAYYRAKFILFLNIRI